MSGSSSDTGPVRGRDDDAVTAVIGTILILAITVMSVAMALSMGAPIVQKLQNKAALETAVGQFEQVRISANLLALENSSRTSTLFLPDGVARLGPGSHFLISLDATSSCYLNLTGWSDWGAAGANAVTVSKTGCAGSTLAIYERSGKTLSLLPSDSNGTLSSGTFASNKDYHFVLTSGGTRLSEAWLIHSDRLSWSRSSIGGRVTADLEAGTTFTLESGILYRVSGPRIDENGGVSLAMSFPTFQASEYAGVSTSRNDQSVFVRLDHRPDPLNASSSIQRVRIDVHGDLAEGWCNALLQRNTAVPLDGRPYSQSPTRPCSPATDPVDGVRGVVFDPPGTAGFPVQIVQSILYAEFQV